MTKDKRIINLRFIFICFIGIMLGILSSYFLLTKKISVFVFVLFNLIVAILAAAGIVYSIKIKKNCLESKFRKQVPSLVKWSSVGLAVSFVIGVLITISPVLKMINIPTYNGSVVVSGVVCDYVDREDTYVQFVMKNCKVINNDKIEEIDMKVVVNSTIYTTVSLGDFVTIEAELDRFNIDGGYGLSRLSQGIGYTTYASTNKIVKSSGDMELKDKVHSEVKGILDNNLNNDNAEICFAVLFGQKYGLADSIKNMFSYSGISHILAVSGLHIGVLVSIIWFALRKLKINDYIKLVIFATILVFYSYLCSFSPSVCRASIMAFVLAICRVNRLEYDITNSLGFAGFVILLFNPMNLFSVSFQLSFMCIFAIITVAPLIRNCLNKIKCPKVLSQALAISIAVNIVILPVCMNIFSEVSLLGIIANIFVLPIFSVTYILLFTIILLSLVIRPLGVLLVVPNLFLHIIKTIAYYFSLIPFAVFRVFSVSYWLLVLVFIIAIIIHFLMIKQWIKYSFVMVLSIISLVLIINGFLPNTYDNNTLIIAKQYKSNVLIYTEEDTSVMIGCNISINDLDKLTRNLRIKEIDKIVAYDLQLNMIDQLYLICDNYSVESVVLPANMEYSAIVNKLPNVEIIEDNYLNDNLSIDLIRNGEEIIGAKVNKLAIEILMPLIDNTKTENRILLNYYSNVDYIVTSDYNFWQEVDANIIDLINTETVFM